MLSDWASEGVKHRTYGWVDLKCPQGPCFGVLAVHRACFALSMFHLIMAFLVSGVQNSRQPRAAIQNGYVCSSPPALPAPPAAAVTHHAWRSLDVGGGHPRS